jgi:hypothetical protein
MREYVNTKKIDYSDFIKGLKSNGVLKESSKLKVLHKGLEISGPSVRCIWVDNSSFDEIKTDNLDLDIPKNVN